MKYSICIPVFNMQATIEGCLRSAFEQDFEDFEVLLLDNCSTDSTYEKALAFASHPRVRVIRNGANLGAYGNHNEALRLARGEWVKFLHGDDELLPDCLREFDRALERCPADIALLSSGAIQLDLRGREAFRTEIPDDLFIMRAAEPSAFLLEGNFFGTPSMCLIHRQRLIAAGGFDSSTEPGADTDAWILLRRRHAHAVVPAHLVRIRDDPPGGLNRRARRVKVLITYTINLAKKWQRVCEGRDQALTGTIYGQWVCHDVLRLWPVALKFLGIGRPGVLVSLWSALRREGLAGTSLKLWLAALVRGRDAQSFRPVSWMVALAHLRIAPSKGKV